MYLQKEKKGIMFRIVFLHTGYRNDLLVLCQRNHFTFLQENGIAV